MSVLLANMRPEPEQYDTTWRRNRLLEFANRLQYAAMMFDDKNPLENALECAGINPAMCGWLNTNVMGDEDQDHEDLAPETWVHLILKEIHDRTARGAENGSPAAIAIQKLEKGDVDAEISRLTDIMANAQDNYVKLALTQLQNFWGSLVDTSPKTDMDDVRRHLADPVVKMLDEYIDNLSMVDYVMYIATGEDEVQKTLALDPTRWLVHSLKKAGVYVMRDLLAIPESSLLIMPGMTMDVISKIQKYRDANKA